MKNKKAAGVSIIGGSDGPASMFIAGKMDRSGIKKKIKIYFYKRKRIKAEKIIKAEPHTLEEVIQYMEEKFHAVRIPEQSYEYMIQRKNIKESFIIKYKPEIINYSPQVIKLQSYDEASVEEYFRQIDERSAKIEELPEDAFPLDFSIYSIKQPGKGELKFTIEKNWNFFTGSFSGDKRDILYYENILKNIYLYYGVTEKDISERSERYEQLVTALILKTII